MLTFSFLVVLLKFVFSYHYKYIPFVLFFLVSRERQCSRQTQGGPGGHCNPGDQAGLCPPYCRVFPLVLSRQRSPLPPWPHLHRLFRGFRRVRRVPVNPVPPSPRMFPEPRCPPDFLVYQWYPAFLWNLGNLGDREDHQIQRSHLLPTNQSLPSMKQIREGFVKELLTNGPGGPSIPEFPGGPLSPEAPRTPERPSMPSTPWDERNN